MDSWQPSDLSPEDMACLQSISPNFPLEDAFKLAGVPYPDQEQIHRAEAAGGETALQMRQAIQAEQEIRDQLIQRGCTQYLCTSSQTRDGVERALAVICDELLMIRQA